MAAAISGVEGRHDTPVAGHDEPHSRATTTSHSSAGSWATIPTTGSRQQELVASVYPHNGEPKPVSGWTYSYTNYILAQMIVDKAGGKPYAEVLRGLFDQAGLKTPTTNKTCIRRR